MIGDSKARYGSISRLLHWVMAVLLVWQGMKFFDRVNDGEHWIGETLVPWHVSIGSVILLLIILRIAWAWSQRKNRPEQDPATAAWVKAGHFLLYAAILVMPLTGLMILIGGGYGWRPFGIELVGKAEKIAWLAGIGRTVHSPLAWLLLVMVAGHVGIALYHRLVKKDDVLQRML